MTKPLYALTNQDIYNLARSAMDSACLTIQHELFNDSNNDFAEQFFIGQNFDQIYTVLEKYIRAEITNHILKD